MLMIKIRNYIYIILLISLELHAGPPAIRTSLRFRTQTAAKSGTVSLGSLSSEHPLGVRPDCTEKKGSVSILEDLASKPEVENINDFLKGLPKDMFQTFTLVTNSRSAQRGEGDEIVSEAWPRVLRASADGKITFSYTCNPKSITHNTVEVIYFDDKDNKTKTVSINLNAKDGKARVQRDDKKCLSCHGTVLPDGSTGAKYIWPQYFQWGGCDGQNTINLYGSNDDDMDPKYFRRSGIVHHEYEKCEESQIAEKKLKEIEAFQKFKEKNLGIGANDNPCYSTLPWAKPKGEAGSQYDPKKYANYPYASSLNDVQPTGNTDSKENYYLRTNLRFTEMYARQNAKQIFGVISKSPKYDIMKYFLALEAASCLNERDEDLIKSLFPKINYKYEETFIGVGSDPSSATPLLYAYAKSIGLKDSDWSLEYKATNKNYTAAIPRTSSEDAEGKLAQDTGMAEVAAAFVIKDLESESAKLKAAMKNGFTRGVAEGFGEQWACIDDLGGVVRESHRGPEKPICGILRESLQARMKKDPISFCSRIEDGTQNALGLKDQVNAVVSSLNDARTKKGKSIVGDRCVWCHMTEKDQAIYKRGDAIPQEKIDEIKRNIARSDLLVDNLKSGIMPQDDPPLSQEDIDSVLLFMKGLK